MWPRVSRWRSGISRPSAATGSGSSRSVMVPTAASRRAWAGTACWPPCCSHAVPRTRPMRRHHPSAASPLRLRHSSSSPPPHRVAVSSSSCRTSAARATGFVPWPHSPRATRSSPSRSTIPAKATCPMSASSRSSMPRAVGKSGSTRRRPRCAGASPRRRPPSEPRSRRELRRLGVGHIVLSTATSWLPSLAAQLRVQGRAS